MLSGCAPVAKCEGFALDLFIVVQDDKIFNIQIFWVRCICIWFLSLHFIPKQGVLIMSLSSSLQFDKNKSKLKILEKKTIKKTIK